MHRTFVCATALLMALATSLEAAETVSPHVPGAAPPEAGAGETPAPPPPQRPKAEIEKDIQLLEARRADLLTRFAPAHPDVRAVERRLAILRAQLRMLGEPAR